MLKWWCGQRDLFLGLESGARGGKVSWFLNVPHGNMLLGSLGWFVTAANCRPAGFSYKVEVSELPADAQAELDVKAMMAVQLLKSGRLLLDVVKSTLGVGAQVTARGMAVDDKRLVGADGFQERHRGLLREFRACLAPYVGQVPALVRFVNTTDVELGVALADLYGGIIRSWENA
jgi:hypothetical protein